MGLQVRTTPYYIPGSSGLDESFVKTFKGDYAHMNPLHDAKTFLDMITGWFHDYNGLITAYISYSAQRNNLFTCRYSLTSINCLSSYLYEFVGSSL
jgi:hypothetical protein